MARNDLTEGDWRYVAEKAYTKYQDHLLVTEACDTDDFDDMPYGDQQGWIEAVKEVVEQLKKPSLRIR